MTAAAVAELSRHCAEARGRYRGGGAVGLTATGADPCLELFRRAIVGGDPQAWSAVVAAFDAQVASWVRRHPSWSVLPDPVEDYVSMTWARFERSVGAERFAGFPRLAAVLAYLQRCAASTLLDEARRARARVAAPVELAEPLHDPSGGPDQAVAGADERRLVWERVEALLHDERERIVLREAFLQQRPPREIWTRHPERFASPAEVSRTKENVLARLRRAPSILALRARGS